MVINSATAKVVGTNIAAHDAPSGPAASTRHTRASKATYYPTQTCDSYTAAASESLTRPPNSLKYTVLHARKGQARFFNALDGNVFGKVINPVVIEPVVQFTLYLKVKYDAAR